MSRLATLQAAVTRGGQVKPAPPLATSAKGGILQRKCACGGTPGPTGDCESCRKKKLQRRSENLGPASISHPPSSVSDVPPIVHEVLGSPGRPLDSDTRAFMEPRFGHSFGDVRIHADTKAAASARAVNALAYTAGNHIVFGNEDYAAQTTAARRVLAHELAHVVQQSNSPTWQGYSISHPGDVLEQQASLAEDAILSGQRVPPLSSVTNTLQRAVPAGLEVKGKETAGATGGTWSVFFERNNATLDTDGKIGVHFANRDPKADFDLRGYVSEDEVTSPAVGQALAENRIKAVDTELSSIGHSGKRNAQPFPNVGDGRLDYRDMRSVEIAAAGAKATTPDCKTTAANGPCPAAVETKLAETLTAAQGFITKARRLLTSGIDTETNDLRDEYFGGGGKGSGAAVTTTLDTNLGKIAAQMDLVAKPKQHQCGTVCNPNCGAIAYNQNAGPTAKLTLCPGFVDAVLTIRARNFIHETAHGAPDIGIAGKTPGTEDWAYGPERRLPRLTAAQALQNSDSYAYFVMLSADPTAIPPRRPEDEVSGVKTNEEGGVHETLTLLADWLKWAPQEMRGTYSTMVESRAPKTAWTNSHYEKTMKLVAARFGLTMPPTLPTDDDRFAVAGISDRYERMGALSRRKLNVTRDPAVKKTVWSDGPGNSVTLGDDFFAITDAVARTRLLLTALVGKVGEIVPADQTKFVLLAEDLNALHPLP